MTTVARAVLEISTDASGVDSGIASVKSKVGSLSGDLKGLAGTMGLAFGGAAVVSGIKNLIAGTFEYAENITDLSERLGISTETTQKWKYAAEQSGSSIETFAKGAANLSKELAGGGGSVESALKSAGLQLSTIRQMKPEEAFNATVTAISKMPDPLAQVKVGTELFGKSWIEMAPAVKNGFIETANGASFMSKQTIKDLDAAKQSMDNLGNSLTILTGKAISFVSGAGEAIGGWFYRVSVLFSDGVEGLRQYDRASADLAKSQEKLAAEQEKTAAATEKANEAARNKAAADAEAETKARMNAEAQKRLAEAFQKQVDVLTGKALAREVNEFSKEVAAAGKQGGLTEYQYKELGKRLDEMKSKGASLPNTLHAIWLEHERLNPSIKFTEFNYKNLYATLDQFKSISLTLPPPPPFPFPVSSDPWGIVQSVRESLAMTGNPDHKLSAAPVGLSVGGAFKRGFSESLKGMGEIIIGAIQGGGNVGKSIGGSIGLSIGNDLAKTLGPMLEKTLGKSIGGALSGLLGPLGALGGQFLGDLAGKALGWISKSNDTKKMREQFASDMGMTLSELYADLGKQFGAEGDSLANRALNVIGRKDVAAQQAWFKEVEALYAKQKQAADDAADATEDAAEREADAHKKVTDAIQDKIDKVSEQYDQVFDSIKEELENPEYDEAGNRIYGVEEARGLARLEQLQAEKDALQQQAEEAKALQDEILSDSEKKITDAAGVIRTGIEDIFKDPIRVVFDIPRVTLPGGGTFGGGYDSGRSVPTGALSRASGAFIINHVTNLDGRQISRNQRRYQTEDLERG